MRVVRQQRPPSPARKVLRFWKHTPPCTKAALLLFALSALLVLLISSDDSSPALGLFAMRPTEIALFLIAGATDLGREQRKGSILFLMNLSFKMLLLFMLQGVLNALIPPWPTFGSLAATAIPVQCLVLLMVEDALADPTALKYYLTQPLQVTSRFYPPLFLSLLLLAQMRVDIAVPCLLGVALHFAKFRACAGFLALKIEERLYGERMMAFGLLRSESEGDPKPLQDATTNDSIVF